MKYIKLIFLFILENIMTLLTVCIGAFVVLKNQQEAYEVSKLLEWVITLLALIATSLLIDRFSKLRRIENKITSIEETVNKKSGGLQSLDSLILNRKKVLSVEDRFDNATNICITGGSLFRLTSEYLGYFEGKLKEGCSIKVLLVDPESESAKILCKHIVYEINDINKYLENIKSTIENFKILKSKYPDKVQIKILNYFPTFSLIITNRDNKSGFVSVEFYTQAVPTRERPQIMLKLEKEPIWYKFFINQFDMIWSNINAQSIE